MVKPNIKHWIVSRFSTYKEYKHGQDIRVNCPFCNQRGKSLDQKQHLYISTVKPTAHCFRCEWAGSYIKLIMGVDHCSYAEALKQIKFPSPNIVDADEILKSLIHQSSDPDLPDTTQGVPKGFIPLTYPEYKDDPLAWLAVHYLVNRGLEPKSIFSGKWGIVPDKPYVFTTIERKFWQGRRIVPGEPRYLNPQINKDSGILFNGQHLVHPDKPKIYITEGIFSCLTLEKRDKVLSVALLAKSAVDTQIKRLAGYSGELCILLDAGEIESTLKLADQLSSAGHTRLLIGVLKENDPDECGEWYEFRYDDLSSLALYSMGIQNSFLTIPA